jgi:group I intron endonuclease
VLGYVYLVTNLVNGKKYVGCTKVSIKRRWAQHRSAAIKGSTLLIHRAIRKYGESVFKIEQLEVLDGGHADLMAAEIRHIDFHNCVVPNGYNLTMGGDGVDLLVPTVREKHRASMQKLYVDPVWQKATTDGARKRSANHEWKKNVGEAAIRKVADPVWQRKHREGIAKIFANPLYLESLREGIHRRSSDPKWHESVVASARKRVLDPSWQKANEAVLALAHAAATAKAVAMDAKFPPDIQVRRARRRERGRLRKAVKRALLKTSLSPEEELAARERQRVANKRSYEKRKKRLGKA